MNEPAILVITEDPATHEQFNSTLRSRSFQLKIAGHGEQGLRFIHDKRYDLVFIEMGMEISQGIDLLALLRQQDADTVCVLITNDEHHRRVNPVDLGAYDILKKPFREDDLLRVVDRALEYRRLTQEVKRCQAIEVDARWLAEERARLEELDRAKAAFIRLVTHEMQAPTSAIITYLDLILQGYITPADQKDILKRSRERAQEQLDMIADLIELGHMKEMVSPNPPALIQMEAVLEKVIQQIEIQAAEKNIHISKDVSLGLDPVCLAEEQAKSIWANLLSNAIKYTPPGGKILIVLRQEGSQLLGQVIDTGIGIPEYALGSLFTEFYRAPNAKSAHIPGTGLGLAIVRQIIQKAGGNIWAESVESKGSTFSFTLPVSAHP